MIKQITIYLPNNEIRVYRVGENNILTIHLNSNQSEISINKTDGFLFYGNIPYVAAT